jgi:hypothetical protein
MLFRQRNESASVHFSPSFLPSSLTALFAIAPITDYVVLYYNAQLCIYPSPHIPSSTSNSLFIVPLSAFIYSFFPSLFVSFLFSHPSFLTFSPPPFIFSHPFHYLLLLFLLFSSRSFLLTSLFSSLLSPFFLPSFPFSLVFCPPFFLSSSLFFSSFSFPFPFPLFYSPPPSIPFSFYLAAV